MSEEYIIYKYNDVSSDNAFDWTELGLTLKVRKYFIKGVPIKSFAIGALSCLFRHRVYCLYDNHGLVHYSFLIPHCSKYPFTQKKDYVIGPCWTDDRRRGEGIYGRMLNYLGQVVRKQSGDSYVLVREANISSTKGITKARFDRAGVCTKSKMLKHYKYYKLFDKA